MRIIDHESPEGYTALDMAIHGGSLRSFCLTLERSDSRGLMEIYLEERSIHRSMYQSAMSGLFNDPVFHSKKILAFIALEQRWITVFCTLFFILKGSNTQ